MRGEEVGRDGVQVALEAALDVHIRVHLVPVYDLYFGVVWACSVVYRLLHSFSYVLVFVSFSLANKSAPQPTHPLQKATHPTGYATP